MTGSDENQNNPQQERRLAFRIPLRVLKVSTDKSGREIFFGYAKDLSATGMQIQTSNPREVGSKVNIYFELPDKKTKITCEAEIIWACELDPLTKRMPAMGIKFLDLTEESKKELDDYIEKNA